MQDWIIRPQLKGLEGVAGVDAIGGYVKQYHVQPDPMKLIAYGLTFQDIIEALERNNVSTGAGYIEHKGESYVVRADGRIANEEQIGRIVIGTRHGTPVYIHQVAAVGVGQELRTGSASKNGAESVRGNRAHAHRRQQPHRGRHRRRQDGRDSKNAPAAYRSQHRLRR